MPEARGGPKRVALICPHAWPPRDDLSAHVAAEAAALARRGHAVTILAPTASKDIYADGRERLRRVEAGAADAVVAAPGEVLVVSVARALPARRGRRVVGPFDLSAALESAVTAAPFDVTHLHEPLAPSPALAALRHASGVRAVTFHRPETAAGAAFLRPLVRRALARVDLRIAASESTRRAVQGVLAGDYALIRPGAAPVTGAAPLDSSPIRLAVVARSRDRAGIRFALSVLRGAERSGIERVQVIAPPQAPWRTRQVVPRSLRAFVEVVPDAEETRSDVLARSQIVAFPSPEELVGPVAAEAMARGAALLVPRSPELEGLLVHGRDALALPPFARDEWRQALEELVAAPGRRAELGTNAARHARTWDDAAAEVEARYDAAASAPAARPARGEPRIPVDLRIRPPADAEPEPWVAACRDAGLRAVAVVAPGGLGTALRIADAAPPDLGVILGQEVATRDGAILGLFLQRDVPAGLGIEESIDAIHAQNGVAVAPHPSAAEAPSAAALRTVVGTIDCWETLVPGNATHGTEGSELARRFGALVVGSSAARTPAHVGRVWTEIHPFAGPADFLESLARATLHAEPPGRTRPRRNARSRA